MKATEAFFSFGLTTKVKNSDLGFYFFSWIRGLLVFHTLFFLFYIVYIYFFLEVVVVCSNIIVIGGIQGEFFDIVLLLYKIIFFFIIYNIIIWQMLTIQYLLHKIIFSWSFCVNKCVSCFTMQSHIHTKV